MPTLVITRGLPGSGKTTTARSWVDDHRYQRVRVNRDDLRRMIYNGIYDGEETEKKIRKSRDALVAAHLRDGLDVVVDDTNLSRQNIIDMIWLACFNFSTLMVWDFTSVSVDACVLRDSTRTGSAKLGERKIREMRDRHAFAFEEPYNASDYVDLAKKEFGANLSVTTVFFTS